MVARIAEIAVNVPLRKCFHYSVPEGLRERLTRGHRVLVPFGPRVLTGVCVGFPEESDVAQLKPIRDILHPACRFDPHLLELTRWVAEYYHAGWGEVLETALPPTIRSGRPEREIRLLVAARPRPRLEEEALRIERRARARARVLRILAARTEPVARSEVLREASTTGGVLRPLIDEGWIREETRQDRPDPFAGEEEVSARRDEPDLNEDQRAALSTVEGALDSERFRAILLHGITGSGKTEVYLRALRRVIERGGRGLVLVPEISLTPQTVLRFREGLPGVPVAVQHSMLSPAERAGQWRDIQEGKARLVIGARSAVFAPIPDLSLVVVDEEHEPSYKQESTPRYHARDVAVVRARQLGIPVILGSATPSLESIHNCHTEKYTLVRLPRRATKHDLPLVTTASLDGRFYQSEGKGLVGDQLDELIRRRLREGEQILIFLNRRGFATYLHCIRCGFVLRCDHCDVSMTFHRRENVARCHYCGLVREVPTSCPDCGMPGPRRSGVGTEKVVEALAARYPEARIARLDRDVATSHRRLRETLAAFSRGDHDMLVGTQMIAKGHDFPRVSLVGILLADTGLQLPDFRAAERTFQLITQVAGRAGRGRRPGRVVVQTFFPDHFAIRHAATADFEAFSRDELRQRETFGYPPFGRLVRVLVSGTDGEKVKSEATRIGERLRSIKPRGIRLLGPVPAPLARLQDRFRFQLLLKAPAASQLQSLLRQTHGALRSGKGADVVVDVDPQSML